ncbi:MAG: hypothetical protein H6526_01260 [Actinobacteria bacterium]|nr:hypothetical protein [Actinomycetota bacterium]MCB8996237.1 hypothetical protein [Actinomycetota bacterium]MCB9413888.1 hypothetical protein [Actinomycetota bacterium]HRY09201.1 hypothetical protein [Candidatus Nanopelagicales bacterium]
MSKYRAIPVLLIVTALLPVAQTAHAADKPTPGTFRGEHGLNGGLRLTFAHEKGIGVYLSRYTVSGELRCDGEPVIPLTYQAMRVTARTAAKVRGKKRTFTYRAATLEITGRFVSAKRIAGTITGKASYCTQSAGFVAKLS